MKKNLLYIFAAAAVIASCSKVQEGDGTLSLSVRVGEPATRAEMSREELLSSAVVKIYKADFSGKVREYRYSGMPESLLLPADDYRVDVTAGELSSATPQAASWDQKSYSGSKEFKIVAGQKSSAEVVAKVCNVVSNVTFGPSVAEKFQSGYSCAVSVGDAGDRLVYTADKSGADGFFIASGFEPSLKWEFSGRLAKDGSDFSKSGEVKSVEAGKRYKLSFKFTEKNGVLDLELLVDESTNNIYDDIIFEAASTGVSATSRYEIWAGHFTAHADVDESQYDKDKVYFDVRAKGTSQEWTRVGAVRDAEGSFSARIGGLSPETEYEYRLAVTALDGGAEETMAAQSGITTDKAVPVPNGGFETTSSAESGKYKSFYDPASSDESLKSKWWDNGNYGSTLVGSSSVICYPDASDKKEGAQAACLQSRWVVVKFAAGNLFSGRFGELIGTSGGTVFFGRPFTARPTAMRFWMKYSGGVINCDSGNVPADGKKGNYDKAMIRVALGTWDYKKYGGDAESPVLVNTTDVSTFVDYSTDPSTIALGEKIVSSDESNPAKDWIQVTLPLVYRDETKFPTHIIISCAASMYGDYFSGFDGSKLWIDGVELIYE